MSGVKLKRVTTFPRQVVGGAGIDVEKKNGNFIISLDYAEFGLHSPYVPQPNHRVVIFVQGTNGYFTVPTSVLSAISYVTFDLTTTHNVTLSNGNLTVTNTGSTSTDQGVTIPVVNGKTSGKFYFEAIYVNQNSNNLGAVFGVGVGAVGSTYASMSTGTGGALYHFPGGGIVVGGSGVGSLGGGWSFGDILGVAVDLDNRQIWFRHIVFPGPSPGPWNGPSVNGNPATNTGGFAITSGTMIPYVCFGGTGGLAGDMTTANFGMTSFTGTVPSGFTSGWIH